MDLFEELRAAALQMDAGGEFPDWLLAGILEIADAPDRYADKADLVELLVRQVGDFDPYAGAGCFGGSVGAGTLQATIRQIVISTEQAQASPSGLKCELVDGCRFFDDNMKYLPKAAEYIKNKLCLGDFESCSRFRIYREYGGDDIPSFVDACDAEEVKKATRYLREKQESK